MDPLDLGPQDPRAAMLRGQPPPLSRAQLIAQQQRELEAAQREQQAAYQPIDRAPMEEAYRKRAQSGGTQLLTALAAQQAGKDFAPFEAHYLKQAAAARAPMEMAGGTMTEQGFIEDPMHKQNLNIKRIDARAANLERALQGNITAEEGERLRRDLAKERQDFQTVQNQLQRDNMRVLKGMTAGGSDGQERATFEGYTPAGVRVVTDRQGRTYTMEGGKQTPYEGVITPKAGYEKQVVEASDLLGQSARAGALAARVKSLPELTGLQSTVLGVTPSFAQSKVGGLMGMDESALQTRSAVLREAAQEINALYGAALSAGESKRAEGFMPNANDDPATMYRKLIEAQRWASDKARQISPAASSAAAQRTGLPADASLTVVRTGTRNGKKVQQMSDGSIRDAQ